MTWPRVSAGPAPASFPPHRRETTQRLRECLPFDYHMALPLPPCGFRQRGRGGEITSENFLFNFWFVRERFTKPKTGSSFRISPVVMLSICFCLTRYTTSLLLRQSRDFLFFFFNSFSLFPLLGTVLEGKRFFAGFSFHVPGLSTSPAAPARPIKARSTDFLDDPRRAPDSSFSLIQSRDHIIWTDPKIEKSLLWH